MKRRKAVSVLLVMAMAASMLTGCGGGNTNTTGTNGAASTEGGSSGENTNDSSGVKEFTAFFAVPGTEINDDNEIEQKIAEITGAKCKETWLTGQTAQEAVGTLIAGGEYPDMIEKYNEANPTMDDGTENIPYTILCDDWRYFCLENAPQFLDGYPNDGSCIVDPDELKIVDYNTTPTAKRYFQKLNEEYQKGIVDPESFTQTYDEYIAKLSTGRVLGMIDQWWDFAYNVNDAFKQQGLDKEGCNYVPLPITIDEGMKNQWHNSGGTLNVSSGLAITTSCEDVEGALQFINDLLDQEVHDLRFWGEKGVDYDVDENGEYYRTEDMRMQSSDTAYKASHSCSYSYFPQYSGTSRDGINAMKSGDQAKEFYDGLSEDVQNCFKAYGAETYVDMLGTSEAPGPWYPMYSYSNNMTTATEGGMAWTKMGEVKHEYLPKVVMASDFDSAWEEYMGVYNNCNPQAFIDEMQAELDRRIEEAKKYQ